MSPRKRDSSFEVDGQGESAIAATLSGRGQMPVMSTWCPRKEIEDGFLNTHLSSQMISPFFCNLSYTSLRWLRWSMWVLLVSSQSLKGVRMAILLVSEGWTAIWWYPQTRSIFWKMVHLASSAEKSRMWGIGYWLGTEARFRWR